jgi:hypothetical protein
MDNRPTAPEELTLIRIGHHLWRSRKRKEWPEDAVCAALETVWGIKETLRIGLRKQWLESYEKRINDLRQRGFGKATQ